MSVKSKEEGMRSIYHIYVIPVSYWSHSVQRRYLNKQTEKFVHLFFSISKRHKSKRDSIPNRVMMPWSTYFSYPDCGQCVHSVLKLSLDLTQNLTMWTISQSINTSAPPFGSGRRCLFLPSTLSSRHITCFCWEILIFLWKGMRGKARMTTYRLSPHFLLLKQPLEALHYRHSTQCLNIKSILWLSLLQEFILLICAILLK